MHFLVTGHTGFKGSWLVKLLVNLGHTVSGIALDPLEGDLYEKANLGRLMLNDFRQDIREYELLNSIFQEVNPDVVMHLAAQPLVLESYKKPVETYETNVLGTLNVLRASENLSNLQAQLIVTTDKVYKNDPNVNGYVESDALGGIDPYSASKAMADILTQSWIKMPSKARTSIVRAGNVIGGGDNSKDRIMTDMMTAFKYGTSLDIRHPEAVRPWQHVLDSLSGYLAIVRKLLEAPTQPAWNIGPSATNYRNVSQLIELSETVLEKSLSKNYIPSSFVETQHLTLNATLANSELGWRNEWDFEETVKRTVNWYKDNLLGIDAESLCERDIFDFLSSYANQNRAVFL
jgi:CDP-glucose 4,6-dehydratase